MRTTSFTPIVWLIAWVAAAAQARACARGEHVWVERAHYMANVVVSIRRCEHCPAVDHANVAKPKQYPRPRVNGKAIG